MSIKTALAKYGSGVGYIYLTDSDNIIVRNIPNTPEGRGFAERQMLVSSSIISNISASGTITVTAAGGTITNLSYGGVALFNTATAIGGATVSDVASNISVAINNHISVPEYTAVSSSDTVTVYLDSDQGSSLNGTALASSVTGATTITSTELDGGSYPTGEIDSQLGYKLYLNPSVSAIVDSLTGATDITYGALRKSSTSPYIIRDVEVSSGSVSIDRDGAVTVVSVQTAGSIAASDLTSIDAGIFTDGDRVIIRGKDTAKVTTVKEGGNIELANDSNFLTGGKNHSLTLQFSISDNKWYEVGRSPGVALSVSSLRSASIATPVQGVTSEAINLGGITKPLTAGTDKGYYELTGSGTLTGSVSYGLNPGLVDGDTFIIDYNATITKGSFDISLAGVLLTASQALEGDIFVKAVWDATNSSWVVSLFKDTQGIDLADSVDLATKEDYLNVPSADGYVLVSTTAGVRSWQNGTTDPNAIHKNVPAEIDSIPKKIDNTNAFVRASNDDIILIEDGDAAKSVVGTGSPNLNPDGSAQVIYTKKQVTRREFQRVRASTFTGGGSDYAVSNPAYDTTESVTYEDIDRDMIVKNNEGTPIDYQKFIFRLTDDGQAVRDIKFVASAYKSFTSSVVSSGSYLVFTTTLSKEAAITIQYNANTSYWNIIDVVQEQ